LMTEVSQRAKPTPAAGEPQSPTLLKPRLPSQTMQIPLEEDPSLHLFASCIMKHGHRHQATHTIAQSLVHINRLTNSPPLPIFREALARASPSVRMRSQKTGGKILLKPEALN